MKQELTVLGDISRITDNELVVRLRRLVRADQTLSARLLVHLGELDARGLYREHGCASMFAYCVEELHMSEAEAYLRIHAARLGRQFPLIVQLFAQGSLHLTAIKLLGPHLTPDNHVLVLKRACGKGKREIELLVAELAPKPDVASRMHKLPETGPMRAARAQAPAEPTSVRKAPPLASNIEAALLASPASNLEATPVASPASPVAVSQPALASEGQLAAPSVRGDRTPFALEAPRHRASSVQLSPGRYKVELTAGQALHDKLGQLKNLLRHQVPNGDLAVIVELAVDLLVDKTMKQRFAQTRAAKPRSIKRGVRHRKLNSRYIPRAVVREVHERDGEQCTFVSPDGKRCVHNALFAERDFGRAFMDSKLRHARARTHGPDGAEVAPASRALPAGVQHEL